MIKNTHASLRCLLAIFTASIAASTALVAQTTVAEPAVANLESGKEKTLELSPFSVTEQKDSGYASNRTMAGSRSDKALIELPTAIGIINKEVIDDLAAVDVHQILRFGVSGVTQNQTIGDDVNIRGFRTNGSLRNGTPQLTGAHTAPLYDVERAEVIKGPASMVLGGPSTAVGGAVNYVTIKPTAMLTTDAQLTIADNNYFRLAANVMGPLYKSQDVNANYRVTIGGLKADRDKIIEDENEKYLGGAMALYFGEKTSVDFTAYYMKNDGYRYWNDFLDVSNNGTINNWTPSTTNLGIAKLNTYSSASASPFRMKDAGFNTETSMLETTFLTKLTANTNLRLYANRAHIEEIAEYSRGITMQQNNYMMNRQDIPQHDNYYRYFYQVDLMNKLTLKYATFDTMLGADAQIQNNHSELSVNDATNGGPVALDMRAPDYSTDDAYFAKAMPGRGLPNLSNNNSRIQTVTTYVQENASFWKDRVILVGGMRWFSPSGTRTNNVTKVITTDKEIDTKVHKYGAVFRVTPWLSAYATDAENVQVQIGFTDKIKANDQLGAPLQNQRGTNEEFGLKLDYPITEKVRLYGTVAHFKMALSNVRTFGDLGNGVEGIIQSAQDSSDGWEMDYGMSVKTGQGRIDFVATWLDGDSSIAANPAVQAAGFVGTKISVMAKYTWLGSGPFNKAMVGFGYEDQTGKRNGNFYIPGYSVMDLFGRYNITKKISVQINLSNIGNERIIIAQAASALVQTMDPMRTRLTLQYAF